MRALVFPILLLFLPASIAFAAEDDVASLKKKLRSKDPETAGKALEDLLGSGSLGKAAAREVLEKELPVRERALKKAGAALGALFKDFRKESKRTPIEKLMEEHEKAGKEVVRFALDENKYPNMSGKHTHTGFAGEEYQKGQLFLEARVEVAVGLYNRLEVGLLKLFGQKQRALRAGGLGVAAVYNKGRLVDKGQALGVVKYNFVDGCKSWVKFAETLRKKHGKYGPAKADFDLAVRLSEKVDLGTMKPPVVIPPVILSICALFEENYALALDKRPAEKTFDRAVFDILVARHILLLNLNPEGGWSPEDVDAMRLMNLYRISIGLWPLKANGKIYAAVREHSVYMAQQGEICSSRPQDGFETHRERMRRQGYEHPSDVGELATECPSTVTFVWDRRTMAHHHRKLVQPEYAAGAIARCDKYVNFNTGLVIEDEKLRALVK